MKEKSIISENENSTVIGEYKKSDVREKTFQSESQLEDELIKLLEGQGYEYLDFKTETELIVNLREQLERLNNYEFTNNEWLNFFDSVIANKNNGIKEKTRLIQEDYIQTIALDNGKDKNIRLIDKDNIYNNSLQVINQYENTGARENRYDVTILVNGLPLVHIELKKRGGNLREAFNEINRYQRDSFWANSGLYEFIQIFIISNGTQTKYYSNSTRPNGKKNSNSGSFTFTSYWTDQNNNPILDLMDFARTFLSKGTLLNILTKYCVFTCDEELIVMRPYQIVATERILNRIEIAHNYKYYGSIDAGGYIWHTTGSGKTLTSFKTAMLAKNLDYIDKILFVVDRKDLDYQTIREYDRYQKGAANSNVSTAVLEKQLNGDTKIIITTIQKLSNFVKKHSKHSVYDKEVVFIFDECHRSQFGKMHKKIVNKFKKYYIFGFTGTPIFTENITSNADLIKTTDQVFGKRLHSYTIVNAIADKNVLPFKYEFVETTKMKTDIKDEKVEGIDKDSVLMNKERISKVTDYIIDNFNIKTKNSRYNSIFAVSSIAFAKLYYEAFKSKEHDLKVGIIYSYGINDEVDNNILDENSDSTEKLNQSDRDFLDYAIKDYNDMFGTSFDTSSEKFQNYYKDVSKRMKDKELDILIVVNMFLTGFDSKVLNTLWVDKKLQYHGLIQAFSRTNRIYDSVKTFGNIVCFRDLEDDLNKALTCFADSENEGAILIRPFEDYYYGYDEGGKHFDGYKEIVEELTSNFSVGERIDTIKDQNKFVSIFGSFLKAQNIVSYFDSFKGYEIISTRDVQDYTSEYNRIRENRILDRDNVDISGDIVFEVELVKQIEVNIDYILDLVQKYHEGNMKDKEILITIDKAISASPDLRDKKELIEEFIASLNGDSNVYEDFNTFMNGKRDEELDKIIEEENLKREEAYKFIEHSFENGKIETAGTEISDILPPTSMFNDTNNLTDKKNKVIEKLQKFFDKFYNI